MPRKCEVSANANRTDWRGKQVWGPKDLVAFNCRKGEEGEVPDVNTCKISISNRIDCCTKVSLICFP